MTSMGWFLIGIVVGAGGMWLVSTLGRMHAMPRWYEWMVGGAALLFTLLAVQHLAGSILESEITSAWLGFLALILPAVILAVASVRLVQTRVRGEI